MSSPNHSRTLRVFLVEDHPAVRDGLALLLRQHGVFVAGHADRASDALAALGSEGEYAAAIVDLTLAQGSGLELLEELRRRASKLPLVVYSMHEEPEGIREVLALGARGYVTKRDAVERLVDAVRAVVDGRTYLSPRAAERLAEPPEAGASPPEPLPPKERAVFALLGEGCGVNEIAARLSLSVRTVESYCARLQNRMGLMGMRELRRQAIQALRGRR